MEDASPAGWCALLSLSLYSDSADLLNAAEVGNTTENIMRSLLLWAHP